ncbi:Uma2 family endonuclease [Planktothrix sp. FACHB-1355]|uniref:Uma2 family endonuclease n=1 Tax=Aerosakkonema funiforme FACHB-1375 TaxID=2949571 RepID=A0A926VFC4_9CYAN|nr:MULTISPECIES: Uma2 family endonuclease [Oscillatoriales]MBD2182830.1 Uma2 family endonuclease [Aerosakkonema funiforme FACHB-1375]MBD3560971.1 Uma2 family endonuclease [Planktothrix sp. FACHB-1355]
MSLTVRDLEKFQAQLSSDYDDYQIELQEGNIIIMGPSDIVSSEIGIRLSAFLFAWIEPRKLGRVFDSSGGFILSNTDLRAPDVSFVCAERLRQSPRDFGELVPDLVVEIKSRTDRVKKLREKIQMFLELGARVGILIDPDKLTVTVYRSGGEPTIFNNEDTLTIPELFPGWELAVAQLWPPVFD